MLSGKDRTGVRRLDPGSRHSRRLRFYRAFTTDQNTRSEETEREDVMKHRWSYRGCACCNGSTLSLSGTKLSRRHFMRGMTGAAVAAAVGLGRPPAAAAQSAETAKPVRIDVHHHLSPPSY